MGSVGGGGRPAFVYIQPLCPGGNIKSQLQRFCVVQGRFNAPVTGGVVGLARVVGNGPR